MAAYTVPNYCTWERWQTYNTSQSQCKHPLILCTNTSSRVHNPVSVSSHWRLTAEPSRSESMRPSDKRERRDEALSSKTTSVLPTATSQLPPVKQFVCLFICCVCLTTAYHFKSVGLSQKKGSVSR